MTNRQRVDLAREALKPFLVSQGPADREDAVTDLVTNLMHYCNRHRIRFRDCARRAKDHYRAEKEKGPGV